MTNLPFLQAIQVAERLYKDIDSHFHHGSCDGTMFIGPADRELLQEFWNKTVFISVIFRPLRIRNNWRSFELLLIMFIITILMTTIGPLCCMHMILRKMIWI